MPATVANRLPFVLVALLGFVFFVAFFNRSTFPLLVLLLLGEKFAEVLFVLVALLDFVHVTLPRNEWGGSEHNGLARFLLHRRLTALYRLVDAVLLCLLLRRQLFSPHARAPILFAVLLCFIHLLRWHALNGGEILFELLLDVCEHHQRAGGAVVADPAFLVHLRDALVER